MTTILHIDASARNTDSTSRKLSSALLDGLQKDGDQVIYQDLAEGLPFVTEAMIGAYYTASDARTETQLANIAVSEALVDQLEAADIVVIGLPMYNFNVPASFKAWIDLVARVGRTFRYTATGPVGLLEGKRAYVAVATGGVAIGSEADFLSPYVRFVLGFIGINDVTFITADRLNAAGDDSVDSAHAQIQSILDKAA
ncbi:FMN-dependent NADH-azoreductase [Allohahella marinimesophila]|uniref:FMN dependent NADH:quinone oxidoreductase n=1 Tax=Allohahella marinimesophila TaxID=1054972 RepID=A0ABP7NHK1_9GAMM